MELPGNRISMQTHNSMYVYHTIHALGIIIQQNNIKAMIERARVMGRKDARWGIRIGGLTNEHTAMGRSHVFLLSY